MARHWRNSAGLLAATLAGSLTVAFSPTTSATEPTTFTQNTPGAETKADASKSLHPSPTTLFGNMLMEPMPGTDSDAPEIAAEIEETIEEFQPNRIVNPATANVAAAGPSGLSIVYVDDQPPADAKTAIERAMTTWSEALTTSSGPIVVEVGWKSLGGNVLGFGGPSTLHLSNGEWVPAGLRNTQTNTDVNGSYPEVRIVLNSDLELGGPSSFSWHTGTGTPANGQLDLETTVLHELGHGLGFIGGAVEDDSGVLSWPEPGTVFDNEIYYQNRAVFTTGAPVDTLTSNQLEVDVSDTHRHHLHAPADWQDGSSLSHFHETATTNAGELMTPIIASGSTHRQLDGYVLGVMRQIGWEMDAPITSPVITSVTGADQQPITVDWNGNYASAGYVPDKFRVEAVSGSTVIASVDVDADTTIANLPTLPNGTYTINVVPVDVTNAGDIYGTASTVSNVVVVSATQPVPYVAIDDDSPSIGLSWPTAPGTTTDYLIETSTDGKNWTVAGTSLVPSLTLATLTPDIHQAQVTARSPDGNSDPTRTILFPTGKTFVRQATLDHRIRRLYLATFLREPDQNGFTNWRQQHAQKKSLETIANGFTNSAEFRKLYGTLNNTQFVEQLYLNVFGRPLDNGGRATWVGLLNNGSSRGRVLIGLANSAEFVASTQTEAVSSIFDGNIYRLYVAYFKRWPDNAGFNSWKTQRQNGASLNWISDQFAKSAEFRDTYGSLNNEEFVDLVYRNVLGREADAQGRKNWIYLLDNGWSRGRVMAGFSESAEFILATGSAPT